MIKGEIKIIDNTKNQNQHEKYNIRHFLYAHYRQYIIYKSTSLQHQFLNSFVKDEIRLIEGPKIKSWGTASTASHAS